jgi:hypothetical protein
LIDFDKQQPVRAQNAPCQDGFQTAKRPICMTRAIASQKDADSPDSLTGAHPRREACRKSLRLPLDFLRPVFAKRAKYLLCRLRAGD